MMDSILWDNATRDYDAEQHTAQLERARVALADTVPFIVKAASHDEYLDRIALMQDKIEATLRGLASSDAEYVGLFGAVMSSLDEDFNTLRQARRVKAEAEVDAEEPEDDSDAPEASEDAEEASDDEDEGEDGDEPEAAAESDDDEGDEPEAADKEASRKVAVEDLGLGGMKDGEVRGVTISGRTFSVQYGSEMAMNDYGRPAHDYTKGWFIVSEVTGGSSRHIKMVKHTPHGPTLSGAKPHAARQAADAILAEVRRTAKRKRAVRKTAMRVDDVLPHAIEALWFAGGTFDGEPFTSNSAYDRAEMDPSDERMVRDSLEAFLREAGDIIDEAGLSAEQVGHNFVFSATGHGAGFWDRGLGAVGDELHSITERTSQFREGLYGEGGQVFLSSRKRASRSRRPSRKRAVTVQDVYFPADGNFDASDPIAVFVTDRGNYTMTMEGDDPESEPWFPEEPQNPYMSGPYFYTIRDEAGKSVGSVSAYGDEYSAPFDEAVYNAEQLLSRLGVRVTSVRKAGSRKRAVRKTFDEWNREETKRLIDRDGPSFAQNIRRSRDGGIARMMLWGYYMSAAEEQGFEPETETSMFASRRKRSSRKTARKDVKGIAIYPDKRVEEVTISSLSDYQSIVGGLIQPVTLSDGSTLYVNEEGMYLFGPDDFNSIATDVAGLGGASHILMTGILGPAILVGPVSNDGYDTDVTSAARAWVNRVAREASVKRRGSRRHTAGPEMWEVRQHDFHTSPNAAGNTYMVWGRYDSEDEAMEEYWERDTGLLYSPFEVVRVGKNSKRRSAARRRTAYSDEYSRGGADGYDDGYDVGMNKPNAKDRRYEWDMDPKSDYEFGYHHGFSEGVQRGVDERYPVMQPDWFDPADAGERWSDDY